MFFKFVQSLIVFLCSMKPQHGHIFIYSFSLYSKNYLPLQDRHDLALLSSHLNLRFLVDSSFCEVWRFRSRGTLKPTKSDLFPLYHRCHLEWFWAHLLGKFPPLQIWCRQVGLIPCRGHFCWAVDLTGWACFCWDSPEKKPFLILYILQMHFIFDTKPNLIFKIVSLQICLINYHLNSSFIFL